MAESAVRTVVGSVGNLVVHETRFLCGVTVEVEFLKDELMRLQAYLKDADEKWRSGNARVAILVSQVRNAAYEAQNIIEAADYMEKKNKLDKGFMSAISSYARLPSDMATLHKIGVRIRRVRRKLNEIFQSAEHLKIDMCNTHVVVNEFPQDSGLTHQHCEDDVVMVGFQDEHGEIVDQLVDGENMLSVISIVAMGGAGKTTLARKICTSSRVRQNFDIVAWVTLSQTFKGIDLLKDIMKQITKMINIFAHMPCLVDVHLSQLSDFDKLPESNHLPQNLRSFNLSSYAIKQDPMPVLEKLQCLMVLKLEGYTGRTMSCSALGFPRLQILQLLRCPNTEEWKIEAGTMPRLSHMILEGFPKMRNLPEGLLHLPSLNHLGLYKMPLVSVGDDKTLKELQQKGCELQISFSRGNHWHESRKRLNRDSGYDISLARDQLRNLRVP
ncbi:putative disease resistance protein At1g50180 [Lolium rigidum]|uniref:putative disease resistance protein At1g50180 n=1 Tax=Lolium rigidum TaxID=89674 RepID=UPI001F5D1B9E|nr:putative disease resistance protein At1g50180 [Lolium rigidum]